MYPYKLGIKIFLDPPTDIPAKVLVPIFHRWIQTGAVEGMLIDVADYSHVPGGPGIMLVAHEAHYGLDQGGGRPGMLYNRKRPWNGGDSGDGAPGLDRQLMAATKAILRACVQLESEPELSGPASPCFDAGSLELTFFDRLLTPNNDLGRQGTEAPIAAFLDRLWGPGGWQLAAEGQDPRSPLRTLARAIERPAACAELLAGL